MNGEEIVEWLDHVTEWAGELKIEARDYAAVCDTEGGQLGRLEDEFIAVAALAKDLQARLARARDAAKEEL